MQQNLKAIIVLGIIMLVLGSCGCLLRSYVFDIICLDINKTRWVEVDLPLDILVSLRDRKCPLKVMIWLGVTVLVLGPSGWLLWSYLVEIVYQDTEKTAFVNNNLILDILLFFEGPQIPTCRRI